MIEIVNERDVSSCHHHWDSQEEEGLSRTLLEGRTGRGGEEVN